jgi:two-component sensor histidine kinase
MIEHQRHLELMLKEKEILIKEIHHRVKNNLAVVSGLLTLQSGTQTDEATIMALTESQSRIQSIATIHEQLYQDELFTQIEMQSYLKRLTKDIGETYSHIHRNITVKVEGDEVFLNVNQAVPFGILTNELVINAFKYAFEGLPEGLITLSLKKIKDEVTFKVSDNGVGLPENFSPQSNGSLGMTLVQSLALQLGAELNYWTEKGSNFSICFTPEK